MSPSWRPLPEPSQPRRVGESLDRVAGPFGRLFRMWPDLVGESVAAHATPRALRAGRLVVAVDEPGWATQLRWLEADLLRRLGDVFGEGLVTRIEVVVAPPDQPR